MTCIIVLGTPRSGTSVVAGMLNIMGVHMGDELLPPMVGVNDMGFFEDVEFLEAHILLMGSHEDPKVDFQPTRETEARYKRLIAARERDHKLWGVKDPKMCFTLPIFLKYLKDDYRIVLTERSFDTSVDSMQPLYGGMSKDRAITLIGRYRYALEKNLKNISYGVDMAKIFYERIVRARHTALVAAYSLANLIGVDLDDPRVEQAADFVNPELNRHA